MRALSLVVAAIALGAPAYAQDNTGSITQSMQSSSDTSSSITSTGDSPQNQSSAEMTEWIKSNTEETSSSSDSEFGVDRVNSDGGDDHPSHSKRHASRPTPEQVAGTYRITAQGGPFLCTVQLTRNPYFDGFFAVTSSGCPELWDVKRWDFDGASIVLTSASGDVFASFWPRDRDTWAGQVQPSGQRLSMRR
jgi:hypothetical protein